MNEAVKYIVKSNIDSVSELRFGNKNHFMEDGYNYEISMMMLRQLTKNVELLGKFVDVSTLYKCAWCGEYNYNIVFNLSLLRKEERVRKSYKEITYVLCIKSFSYYERQHTTWKEIKIKSWNDIFSRHKCTKNKTCVRNSLNSNSIEYVSKSFGISEQDANRLILERNSSPFYHTNYTDMDAYRRYQNHGIDNMSDEQKEELIKKQNYGRSLDGYIKKYGRDDGKQKWKEIQARKGITPESMIEKYGETLGKEKYDLWLANTRHTYDNFVERYGEDVAQSRWIAYKASNPNSYGNISYTDKGEMLRSDNELEFYNTMKQYNLHEEDYIIERNYPGSTMLSDFYFVKLDMHIEIAGMVDTLYWEKMERKKTEFGAIILVPTKANMVDLCETIRNRIDNGNF